MGAKVAAVLVNWKNWPDTLAAVASLEKQTLLPQIVVVDNGSPNDSEVQLRQQLARSVTVLQSGQNLGWAGGCNLGIHHALERGAEWIWLINNDAVADPLALEKLVACCETDAQVAACGSLIYELDAPQVIWFAGGKIDLWRGTTSHVGIGQQDHGQFPEPIATEYLTGCSLLIRRSALEQVGFLSENYFLYYEDPDWCLKARSLGWRVMLVPDSKVWHRQGNSAREAGGLSPTHAYYDTRSNLYFIERHCGALQRWSAYGWFLLRKCARALTWLGKAEEKVLLPATIAGIRDYLRRHTGVRA
ncbi:MAG: glycosyltransferase family 2 protein [Anaerolineae bacterium]|nr:glycosyltransferase family 2 protein [Gloeobacterales cyanobacterium ES-bin-313]